jgi:hypothetical protein
VNNPCPECEDRDLIPETRHLIKILLTSCILRIGQGFLVMLMVMPIPVRILGITRERTRGIQIMPDLYAEVLLVAFKPGAAAYVSHP